MNVAAEADRDEIGSALRLLRHISVAGSIWLALLVLLRTFSGDLNDPFLSPLLLLLLLFIGVCIAFGALVGAASYSDQWRQALLIAGVMPVAFLLSFPLTTAAHDLRFMINKAGYDRIVAQLDADPTVADDARRQTNAGKMRIDDGLPRRIAFVTWEGIPDPWGGIIHDPSNTIASAPPLRTRLFESTLIGCRPLWDGYYQCRFT